MMPYYEDDSVTLYHGKSEDVLPRIADGAADLVLTDPPYNCVNRPSSGLRSLDKGAADSEPVSIPDTARELVRVATGSIYVWCGDVQLSDWLTHFKAFGLTVRGCTWHKTNPSPMNGEKFWLSAAEYCAFARKPKAYFSLSCQHNVWVHKTDQEIDWHPTPKPLGLMRQLVDASCPPGGVVLDAFAGSGTTLRAAVDEGRKAIGIEMNEGYCEGIAKRLAQGAFAFDFGSAS